MVPSVAGVLVCVALLVVGWLAGDAILIGLFASFAFSATAITSVFGGSSVLIYTVFESLLILKVVVQRDFIYSASANFKQHPSIVIGCIMAIYAFAGAVLLPRLFAGSTTVFVPIAGLMREVKLAPVTGNFNQTAYFIMGIIAFVFITTEMSRRENLNILRSCLFSFAITNVLLGLVDLAGKLAAGADWLASIRTGNFALLTDTEITGFWRIVGGCAEASGFAINCLASLGFAFVYWRRSGSGLALGLTASLLLLLIFSTSSTAYVGLAVLAVLAAGAIGATLLNAKLRAQDLLLFFILLAALTLALGAYLYNEKLFDPLTTLVRTMVLEKHTSDSAQERSYWNYQSFQAFLATDGFGIGMGSSRSSSLPISILSQLGLIGFLFFGALTAVILRGAGGVRVSGQGEVCALAASARAMAIGWLTGMTISGSGADPGLLFFLLLAIIVACRTHLLMHQRRAVPIWS